MIWFGLFLGWKHIKELNQHLSQSHVNAGFIKRINKPVWNEWMNGDMHTSAFGILLFRWLLGESSGFCLSSFVWGPVRVNPTKAPMPNQQMGPWGSSLTPKRRFPVFKSHWLGYKDSECSLLIILWNNWSFTPHLGKKPLFFTMIPRGK